MAEPRRLDSSAPGFEAELGRLLAFEAAQDEEVDSATARILDAVRDRGNEALPNTPRASMVDSGPASADGRPRRARALRDLPAAERGR